MKRFGSSLGLLLLATQITPHQAQAWGEKGHHLVCEVASQFVKEKGLKDFLKMRSHLVGHLCNIPDIHWKNAGVGSREGDASHYFEPDMFQVSVKEAPTSIKDFIQKISHAGEPAQALQKTGTLWWRAEQLTERATAEAKKISLNAFPANNVEEQLSELPYNSAIYGMLVNMGLLGHFVGDASMPYHNWADYDGYGSKHGGIHAYYESICVGEYGIDLNTQVALAAKALPDAPKAFEVTLAMKVLSSLAVNEVSRVEKLDVTLEPSNIVELQLGATKKIPAKRPSPEEQCPKFRPLIVHQMARSVKMLAAFWDKIYKDAKSPDLSRYRSYRYPLAPDFVKPDYLEAALSKP